MRGCSGNGSAKIRPVLVLCLALVMSLPAEILANVYATKLEASAPAFAPASGGTVTLSFILNENADNGVVLKIYRAAGDQLVRTVNLGPLTRGTQTWVWDGKNDAGALVPLGEPYYFTVTASDDGYSEWTPIIDETVTDRCKYYSPRGVDVNKDPRSKYYGRIYVSEAYPSGANQWSGSPKVTEDGIYILNADGTDAVGQGDHARTGGVTWVLSSYSPWRCTVGPDDCLYVCDNHDSHPGLWVGDPDFLSAQSIFDPAGADSTGLTSNHGNILGAIVEGVGPDRVIYTLDEDYPGNVAQRGSVWQYNVGNSQLPWWGKPDAIPYNDNYPVNIMQNTYQDFAKDSEGNWYISQNRADGTDISSVIKVAQDQTLLFLSLTDWGGQDVLRNTYGLALDDARNRVAVCTYNNGRLIVTDKDFDLERMQVISPVGVWAVGSGGTILRSADRGRTWINVTSPTTNDLNDIFMRSSTVGYAVGNAGTFLRTTDGGATWTIPSTPGSQDLKCVRAFMSSSGSPVVYTYYVWAVGAGGAIYVSADSGATWSAASSGTTQDLNWIDQPFGSATTGQQVLYVCGNGGVILKSVNSGTSWSLLNSGTTANLYSIGVARHRHLPSVQEYGWAVGDNGTILRTTDSGATWVPQVVPELAGKKLKSVSVVTSLVAKVVAEDGTVAKTKDGGATWTIVSSGAPALNCAKFVDPALGWAVGPNGKAYVSRDGGATWTEQTTGVTTALKSVFTRDVYEQGKTIFSTWRDAAFDAVGNLYAIDNNLEILRVYSPPDGPNSSTTKSYGVVVPTAGDVTPPSIPVVFDDGDEQNSMTTMHVTWTAASDPESGVVEYACAISGVPMDIGRDYVADWRSVGNVTEYTFTGLNLKLGTYYVLVKAKNGAGIWSEAGVSDGIKILFKYSTIGEIKACKDTSVIFENYENPCIVTYVDPGDLYGSNAEKWFWVEQLTPDGGLGAAGLKVNAKALGNYFPPGMTAGATITRMSGTLVLPTSSTDPVIDLTRELRLDSMPTLGGYTDLPPFICMNVKSYGGGWRSNVANPGPGDGTPAVIGAWVGNNPVVATGLNTEGLLIRVTGKVLGYGEDVSKGWMWCYVDDGSGVPCEGGPDGYKGIKVIRAWDAISAFPRSPEDIGKQVVVQGICCNRYISGSGRIRMMLMRTGYAGAEIDTLQFIGQ